MFAAGKANPLEQGAPQFFELCFLPAELVAVLRHYLKWQQHVFKGRAPRQQVGGLERHANTLLRARHLLAPQIDIAIARWRKPGDQLHQGGLATARRAHHRHKLIFFHAQGDVFDRQRAILSVTHAYILKLDKVHLVLR